MIGKREKCNSSLKILQLSICGSAKGNRYECDNRGISPLTVGGKVFVGIILNKLDEFIFESAPQAQCDFRSGRRTVNMSFRLRQAQEKQRNKKVSIYCFRSPHNDLRYCISNCPLKRFLEKIKIKIKTLHIISFHEGMQAFVRSGSEKSDTFFFVSNSTKFAFLPFYLRVSFLLCVKKHSLI